MSKRKNAQLVRLEPDVSEMVESGQKVSGRSVQAEVNYTLRAAYQRPLTETESLDEEARRIYSETKGKIAQVRIPFKMKIAKFQNKHAE